MQETLTQIISGIAVAAIIAAGVALRSRYKRLRDILAGLDSIKDMQLTQTGVGCLKDAPHYQQLRTIARGIEPKEREVESRLRVRFKLPFAMDPTIAVSLRKIDLGDVNPAKIHRLAVSYDDVTPNGFVLCFKTWNESLVFDAEATWIAIGRPALK